MKKITFLLLQKERENFLLRLRDLGIVHVQEIKEPQSIELHNLRQQLALTGKALACLNAYNTDIKIMEPQKRPGTQEIINRAEKIVSACIDKKTLIDKKLTIQRKMAWFKPWGAFDPKQIAALTTHKVFIKLYCVRKNERKKIARQDNMHIISRDKNYLYIAYLSRDINSGIAYEQLDLPDKSYSLLEEELASCVKKLGQADNFIKDQLWLKGYFNKQILSLKNKEKFFSVLSSMEKRDALLCLQGFCPADSIKAIISAAKQHGFGCLIDSPGAAEEVPTLIRTPKWAKAIKPVFKFLNIVPGYNEYDISPVFFIFLSIFFAMLIGDAGYGLVFLGLNAFLQRKFKKIPKEVFSLMYVMSIAAICWGAITGTWFGFEKIAELPLLNKMVINRINSFTAGNRDFIILGCFFIGAVHLTIAHIIKATKILNSLKAAAELGWIFILWGIFFLAGKVVIGRPMPDIANYAFFIGGILVLLFSNPQKNIFKGVLISLVNLPLKAVSSFADVVSYIRLFAVGYASVVVAGTFNQMAINIGAENIFCGLGAALVLFMGHFLNIILGVMAVIVHGIRLNILEFSSHMEMDWSGIKYAPFKKM